MLALLLSEPMPKPLADEKSPPSLATQYDHSFLTQRVERRSPLRALRYAKPTLNHRQGHLYRTQAKGSLLALTRCLLLRGVAASILTAVGVPITPQKATATGSD